MRSEKSKAKLGEWRKKKTIVKCVRFNIDKDKDILEFIDEIGNFSSYLKNLIRNDMN